MAFSNVQIANIIYQYIVEGTSMENIGQGYSVSTSDISKTLEPYHFGGAENKSVNGNFKSGTNRGAYKNGVSFTNADGEVQTVLVDEELLLGYVNANKNRRGRKQTLEEYLMSGGQSDFALPGIFSTIIVGIVGIIILILLISLASHLFGGKKTSGIVGKTGQGPFAGPFSGITSYFSNGYEVEAYEVGNWVYVGNKKRNKPNGINFRYTNHTNAEYDLAGFSSEVMSGEGVSYDYNHNFYVGSRKKSVFSKSWVLVNKNNSNEVSLAYYKKGEPTGVGIVYDGSKTNIVNYSKDKKVIATNSDGEWKKPNGRRFKLKKGNKYKGIEIKDSMNFVVDGVEVCIDPSNMKYVTETFSFEGVRTKFSAAYTIKDNTLDFAFEDARRVYMLYTKEDGSDQGVDVVLTVNKADDALDNSDDGYDNNSDDNEIFDPLGVQDKLDDLKDKFDGKSSRDGDGYTVNEDGSLTLDSGITVTFGDD